MLSPLQQSSLITLSCHTTLLCLEPEGLGDHLTYGNTVLRESHSLSTFLPEE
jgi:hypothetical protein